MDNRGRLYMSQIADLSVSELIDVYRSRRASPVEAVKSCLGRIARLDGRVNAVLTLVPEQALRAAAESTERWLRGEERALEGVPFGLKDIIATAEVRTTGGSALYRAWMPKTSATVAERLVGAGAVLLAKMNTFEFAGGANATTCNPWDLERTAGGSSSGSAAAVAARELPLTIGTDTGGSIAIPAAYVGITGLKPTYGRVPRTGVMPLSWTLDHVGSLTRTTLDAAMTLQVIAGWDAGDPNSGRCPVPDYLSAIGEGAEGLRIGIPTDWFFDICDPEIYAATYEAARQFQDAGATVSEVSLPSTRTVALHAIELTLVYAEMSSLHSSTLDRLAEYGPEFQKLLARGQFVHAADYLHCLRARHLLQLDFQEAFDSVDALIVPGSVSVAPRHDHMVAQVGSKEIPLLDVISRTTAVFDIVGIPTITVPSGFDKRGLPMAVAIATRPYDEITCLRLGYAYQQLTSHHAATPSITSRDSDVGPRWDELAPWPAVIEKPIDTRMLDGIW
jgi:aspartyl-tRNA(Asn)/glutamyl-tRNA(Gln) amidotransferase subunit A